MPESFLSKMVEKGHVTDEFIEQAEKEAESLAQAKFKKSQFRKFYGKLLQIFQGITPEDVQSFEKTNSASFILYQPLRLLKPQLAYAQGRDIKGAKEFREIVEPALDQVVKEKDPIRAFEKFKLLVQGMEAFLAYFTATGAKE